MTGAPAPARAARRLLLLLFAGTLAAVVVLTAAIVIALQPPPPEAPCPPGRPCAPGPPIAASPMPTLGTTHRPGSPAPPPTPTVPLPPGASAPPLIAGVLWQSPLGFSFEYDGSSWLVTDWSDSRVVLESVAYDGRALLVAVAGSTAPSALLAQLLAEIDGLVIGRVPDSDGYDALLGPSIGYVRGVGGVYSATLLSAGGVPSEPVGITVLAATSDGLTVGMAVLAGSPDDRHGDETVQRVVRRLADQLLKTFDWSGER